MPNDTRPLPEPYAFLHGRVKLYTQDDMHTHAAAVSAADNAALREQMERQKNEWLSWAEKRDGLEKAAARVKVLEDALRDALDRMDRARDILTDGKSRPECNWGMLATEAARAALGDKT